MSLVLHPRTSVSFAHNDALALIAWLEAQGYTTAPGRNPNERARLTQGRSLLVVYGGSVLVQGTRPDAARALLSQLVPSNQPAFAFYVSFADGTVKEAF